MPSFPIRNHSIVIRHRRFHAVLVQEGKSTWSVICPELEGCASFGATEDEALKHIQEAIELVVEDFVENGKEKELDRRIGETDILKTTLEWLQVYQGTSQYAR